MKISFIFLTILLFFTACTTKENAFSRFKLSHAQEMGIYAMQSSKIVNKSDSISGTVSIIYLNKVDPKRFDQDGEVFYVCLFLKSATENVKFLLNEEEAESVKVLTSENKFSQLMSVSTEWNSYYLVTFPRQGDVVKFQVVNGDFTSNLLTFEKDE